jgi:hypothetical protein
MKSATMQAATRKRTFHLNAIDVEITTILAVCHYLNIPRSPIVYIFLTNVQIMSILLLTHLLVASINRAHSNPIP